MDIYILRHGDANSDTKKIIDDSKRPLTEAGIKEIENVSKLFTELEIQIARIYSSPLLRAKQSAKIIQKFQKKAEMLEIAELKPEGIPGEACKKIASDSSAVLVVGHNPLLVEIINYVTSSDKQQTCHISLKTGGLAKIKTTAIEPQLQGHLEWLLTPKMARKISK